MPTNRQKRATRIGEILDSLIPDPAVPLRYTSPFTFLIAVLLSAQCTDERVNAITPQLFALAPTPAEMAKLSINQIHAIIRPC